MSMPDCIVVLMQEEERSEIEGIVSRRTKLICLGHQLFAADLDLERPLPCSWPNGTVSFNSLFF